MSKWLWRRTFKVAGDKFHASFRVMTALMGEELSGQLKIMFARTTGVVIADPRRQYRAHPDSVVPVPVGVTDTDLNSFTLQLVTAMRNQRREWIEAINEFCSTAAVAVLLRSIPPRGEELTKLCVSHMYDSGGNPVNPSGFVFEYEPSTGWRVGYRLFDTKTSHNTGASDVVHYFNMDDAPLFAQYVLFMFTAVATVTMSDGIEEERRAAAARGEPGDTSGSVSPIHHFFLRSASQTAFRFKKLTGNQLRKEVTLRFHSWTTIAQQSADVPADVIRYASRECAAWGIMDLR